MPFPAASGMIYDCGDFAGVMNDALKLADYAGFAKRKSESKRHGKLRGIAVGAYLEVTAPPNTELAKITFDTTAASQLVSGTLDYGQGHASPFAQVLSDQLGVPFDKIRLVQGDSDIVHAGNGTGGSRSITAAGQAIVEASKLIIEKGKEAAASVLEASDRRHRVQERQLPHRRHRSRHQHHGPDAESCATRRAITCLAARCRPRLR